MDLTPHDVTPLAGIENSGFINFMPSALINLTDNMTGSLSRFTDFAEGQFSAPSQSGGQLTMSSHTGHTCFLQEGAGLTVPQFAMDLHIVSFTGSGGAYAYTGVGYLYDINNYIMGVWDGINNVVEFRVKTAGTVNLYGSFSITLTPPFDLGFSLVCNTLTIYTKLPGKNWTYATNYTLTSVDMRTTTLINWLPVIYFGAANSASVVVDTLTVGNFGRAGISQISLLTNLDGSAAMNGSVANFTATCQDANGIGYTGIFTYDVVLRALHQIGVLFVNRSATIYNDTSAHIVADGTGGYHVFISTTGNGSAGSSTNILYKHDTSNLLASPGVFVESGMTQQTLAGVPVSGGSFSPSMVKVGSTYYLAWTTSISTPGSFYPVLNSSTNLSTWSLVGQDTNAVPYGETRIVKIGGTNWLMATTATTVAGEVAIGTNFVYDLTMSYQGNYQNLGLGSNIINIIPSAGLFYYQNFVYQFTTDNFANSVANGADGLVRVFRSRRFVTP